MMKWQQRKRLVTRRSGMYLLVLCLLILGLAVLSLVTVSVGAMFVETEERQIERDLMHAIGALRVEVTSLHDELRELKATREADPPA
ncbi:hypothetical protein [Polaromonas sp.]|uniref:hypothetical protein n=1 Tax=Polaromonas sp. TaxID=1869339 RepID=UPI002733A7A4|nr:hypothetical protein [Polaromonas sp.]